MNDDEDFQDCEEDVQELLPTTENIKNLLLEGVKLCKKENFYKPEIYEEAIKKFTKAKDLDAKHKKEYSHHCDYHLGVIYIRKAEAAEDTIEKQQFYKKAAKCFRLVKEITRTNKYNDIDLDLKIGEALYGAGKLEKALNALENTGAPSLIKKIKQEQGSNSGELVLCNQESSILANKAYSLFQNRNTPLSSTEAKEILYHMVLTQQNHEKKINYLEQEIAEIKAKLRIAGIDTEVNIINKIVELEKNDPKSYKYYSCFNLGLQNIYIASKAIASDLVVSDAGHMERKSFLAIEKGLCYIADIMACGFFGPIMSAVVNVGHDAADNIFNTSAEKKVKKVLKDFNHVIEKRYDQILSSELNIQQLALFYTYIKKEEILKIDTENKQDGLVSFVVKKLLPTRKKLFNYENQEYDDLVTQLAFKDLNDLMIYIQYNSETMCKSEQPFILQIENIIKDELKKYYYDNIYTQVNSIEYELQEIENNLSEFAKINKKIKDGQWSSIPLPFISINLSTLNILNLLWSWDILNLFKVSWRGEQRGIETFSNKEYYRAECNKKGVEVTDENLNNFMLLLLHKICKNGNAECIRQFKEKNSDIIELAKTNAPQLFVTEEAIDICVTDPEQNKDAKGVLKLKHSAQFVEDCLNTACPSLAEYKKKAEAKKIEAPTFKLKIEWSGDNAQYKERVVPFDIEDSPRDVPAVGNAIEYNN